jgi:hypothetical protein
MPDKIVLFAIGLTIGFASFAAVGTATSLLMAEVQERVTPLAATAAVHYAQVRRAPDPVMR